MTPELSVFHHGSGSECNHCVVLPHCSEHAEADTFFCFTNLMSENRDNFIKSLDDSQCGITYKMESVYSMLKDKDLELYLKLVRSMLRSHCLICVCPNSLLPAELCFYSFALTFESSSVSDLLLVLDQSNSHL